MAVAEGRIILVKWVDARTEEGWVHPDDMKKGVATIYGLTLIITGVGMVVIGICKMIQETRISGGIEYVVRKVKKKFRL